MRCTAFTMFRCPGGCWQSPWLYDNVRWSIRAHRGEHAFPIVSCHAKFQLSRG